MNIKLIAALAAAVVLTGCATGGGGASVASVDPTSLQIDDSRVPEPIYGNDGEYMCPYTEDGVVAR